MESLLDERWKAIDWPGLAPVWWRGENFQPGLHISRHTSHSVNQERTTHPSSYFPNNLKTGNREVVIGQDYIGVVRAYRRTEGIFSSNANTPCAFPMSANNH